MTIKTLPHTDLRHRSCRYEGIRGERPGLRAGTFDGQWPLWRALPEGLQDTSDPAEIPALYTTPMHRRELLENSVVETVCPIM